MTAITQCPSCDTLFRVVEDQLRISQGWVRCGQCHHVFDAQANLRSETVIHVATHAIDAPSAQGAAAATSVQAPVAPSAEPHVAVIGATNTPWGSDWSTGPIDSSAQAVDAGVGHQPSSGSPTPPIGVDPASVMPPATMVDGAIDPAASPKSVVAPFKTPATDAAPALRLTPMPDVSFIQAPIVVHPARKWALRFATLLAALDLLGQWVWYERDRIVAHHPVLGPHMASACIWLNCEVGPLRDIDALVIDAFAVTGLGQEGYRLNFNLRSRAVTPVASPAVELILQDSGDKTVLRRVLKPAEYGLTTASIAASGEHTASVVFTLREPDGSPLPRIAGYRLFAFYP